MTSVIPAKNGTGCTRGTSASGEQGEEEPGGGDREAAVRVIVGEQGRDQLPEAERIVVIAGGKPIVIAGAEVRFRC